MYVHLYSQTFIVILDSTTFLVFLLLIVGYNYVPFCNWHVFNLYVHWPISCISFNFNRVKLKVVAELKKSP